ncbi:hypothetical protein TanjilG_30930 [Lupinus angustifolius]|uniref:Uncharacterized protein n=1 Tax=Lupinus angustifolius TaxID=3871 RepID=A0A1J7GLQ4_LUPAN|nr:hypothetical protein TanjilG_30930 [Lupinus angustifolius]
MKTIVPLRLEKMIVPLPLEKMKTKTNGEDEEKHDYTSGEDEDKNEWRRGKQNGDVGLSVRGTSIACVVVQLCVWEKQ